MRIGPKFLERFMRYWPLFRCWYQTGIYSEDASHTIVSINPICFTGTWWAQFGALCYRTDPFLCSRGLWAGQRYLVWDVVWGQFIKPGGKITAEIQVSEETWQLIRSKTANGDKYLHWFDAEITDEQGETVAIIRRQVYFRKKREALERSEAEVATK